MDLSNYRKIITLVITAAVVISLQRYGITQYMLPQFGLSLTGIVEPVVDFLISIGIPAVFTLAQPNEEGDTLVANWRWLVGGGTVLAVLIVLAALVF